ncbi:hypothetical protein [Rhizobium sp. Nf11,1]|uniref:hypothetical protein n=1 Tax=Rhizobium sp. Nf11,1 TaxID=3404923 RepID=UPI003D3353D6
MDNSAVLEAVRRGLLTPEQARARLQAPSQPAQQEDGNRSLGDKILGRAMQAAQGATFNFADEAGAAIAAPVNMAINAVRGREVGTFSDNYTKGRDEIRKLNEEQSAAEPIRSIALQGLGGLAQGVGSAVKAAPTVLGRIAQGVGTGAGYGALAGAGAGEGVSDRVGKAVEGGVVGGVTGGVLSAAGEAVGGAVRVAKGVKAPRPTADELGQAARSAYEEAEKSGGVFRSSVTDKFINDAVKGLNPQTDAGKLIAGESELSKISDRLQLLKGRKLSLAEAQEIDEYLGEMIDSYVDAGRLTKPGRKLLDVQTAFRNSIENAPPQAIEGGKQGSEALKEGRRLWSQSAQLRDIQKILTRAELSPQPASAIKSGFRTMVSNPARLRGYSAEAQKLMREAARSGIVGDTLGTFSTRLLGLVGLATNGLGGAVAGDVAASGIRGIGTDLQMNRALKVTDAITGFKPAVAGPASNPVTMGLTRATTAVTTPDDKPKRIAPVTPMQTPSNDNRVPAPSRSPVSDTLIDKIVNVESGGRADAKNPNSSARGAGQFIKSTWLNLMKGEPEAEGKSPREILALRDDKDISRRMVQKYADKNAAVLSKRGVQPTDATIYLAHVLDGPVAAKVLKADPSTPVRNLLKRDVIAANPSIFKGKTAGQVLAWAERKTRV